MAGGRQSRLAQQGAGAVDAGGRTGFDHQERPVVAGIVVQPFGNDQAFDRVGALIGIKRQAQNDLGGAFGGQGRPPH